MQDQNHFTRRAFLGNTTAALVTATLWEPATFSSFGAPAFSPKLAVFSKVYQELNFDFEQSAEATAQAGLDGIDCAVRPGGEILPEHADEQMPRYAETLQKHGVSMLLLTTAIVNPSSPKAEVILRTGKKLGVKYYRLGYWAHKSGMAPAELQKQIKAQLKELAALNREVGMCALFQNHSTPKGRPNERAGGDLTELYEVVKDFNPEEIAVAFDFGHAIITHGDEWPAHFEKLKPHIKVAYIKDVSRTGAFVAFGQGEFAHSDIFQRLRKMNYNSPLSMHIEFDWAGKGKPKTHESLVKTLTQSRGTLQQWLAAS